MTDLVYVDTAINGAFNRNRVMPLATFDPPATASDVYTTYFRYTRDLLDYALQNPLVTPEKRPSVKGFRGVAFAAFFPVDFDHADDPNLARLDAIRALRMLETHSDLPPEAVRIAFSGHKGFALEIPSSLFGGFTPAPDLPHRFGRLARALFPDFPALDTQIYEAVRLWRVINTRHGRSGLYKIPLTLSELEHFTLEEIRDLATSPRPWCDVPDDEWLPRPELVTVWAATAIREPQSDQDTSTHRVAVAQRRLSSDQVEELIDLMQGHWNDGQRHHLALGLAGCLALAGIPEDQAREIVTRLSADDRQPNDRLRCVRDSYARHRRGRPLASLGRLRDHLPPVDLDALEDVLPTRARLVCGPHRRVLSSPPRPRVLRTRKVRYA